MSLPPYSPELSPVERIWLYLEERFLSHRLLVEYEDIVDAGCEAWNKLAAEPGRIKSLCSYSWIPQSMLKFGVITGRAIRPFIEEEDLAEIQNAARAITPRYRNFVLPHRFEWFERKRSVRGMLLASKCASPRKRGVGLLVECCFQSLRLFYAGLCFSDACVEATIFRLLPRPRG